MKTIQLILLIWLTTSLKLFSQNIDGTVTAEDNEPIVGSLIRISDSTIGTFSDENGAFQLDTKGTELPLSLEISYIGFETQIVTVSSASEPVSVILKSDNSLEAVIVEGRPASTDIDPLAAQQVELINSRELLKAACCNLSESFETNATVDVNFSDAVTGSKQISMLGLDGVYAQINWENMPLIRGLGEYYGMNFVPGTWIDQIQVTKGAGSVINGYESMTGQINIEFKKPDDMEKFYLNGYQNLQGRSELNGHYSSKLNDQWSTALFVHGNLTSGEPDDNDDGFIDRNKANQFNVFNRWKYVGKGNLRSQFGLKYLNDQQLGGQVGYKEGLEVSPSPIYGVDVKSKRLEGFAKNGLIFPDQPWKSVGLILNATSHNQTGLYGLESLDAHQNSAYANLIYQTIINDTRHKFKTGANFQYDDIVETVNSTEIARDYKVPGVFAEYEYDNIENIKLILGLRSDYISNDVGFEFSPRVHFKWTTDGENSIRLSAGRGFRVPNLVADNPGLLASSREVEVISMPEIESSWNFGGSMTRYLRLNGHDGTLALSYYRTNFQDQLIKDFYTSPDAVYISALDGQSFANSFQANLDYELVTRLDLRLAYKFDDVKQTIGGELIQKQLTPRHRGLINLAYALPYDRWRFDVTTQYVGEQRLPNTLITPDAFNTPQFSQDFMRLNSQVTTKIKNWEVYLGGENLTNFKQENPIIDAQNPFGDDFDATSVWGPIMGRNIYMGFRMTIPTNTIKN